nr:MAG TPA: Protein of unknown function (DUF3789) [Caudoviricetes sp.]
MFNFFIGVVIGATIGMILYALCVVAGSDDDD